MRTNYRLDKVFRNAFPVPFDDKSRYVFFSDVHRGDDSVSDEFGRNRHIYDHALDYYFDNRFTYVEVGDGDELWENAHYHHIPLAHASTFERLRKFYNAGRMYMLFGNHNMQLKSEHYVKRHLYSTYDDFQDKYRELFPGIHVHEALVMKHRDTGQEIFVVHGHQGDFTNDYLWRFSCFFVRTFWRILHYIMGFKYAASPAKSRLKRHKVEKMYNKWIAKHKIMLICGHTHRAKLPQIGELPYLNTGCCMHPRGITCLELESGKISLVHWRVSTREDGLMYIRRKVVQGPVPISAFHSSHEDREGLSEEF
ncbi:MAG: serine/threonine protein phosphatase [Firmicutes bacterium]|nr:serine/threonine protein phosphatase [Bacillota bacterium]